MSPTLSPGAPMTKRKYSTPSRRSMSDLENADKTQQYLQLSLVTSEAGPTHASPVGIAAHWAHDSLDEGCGSGLRRRTEIEISDQRLRSPLDAFCNVSIWFG